MRHWLQLATRNWRAKPGRAASSTVAIALGVATVVSVTCFYESVRSALSDHMVNHWLGRSHLTVDSSLGHWGRIDQQLIEPLSKVPDLSHITARLKRQVTLTLPETARHRSPELVDAIGIQPQTEYAFREYADHTGRLIRPGDGPVAVLETKTAAQWGVKIGDEVFLAVAEGRPMERYTVVGTVNLRRIAKIQKPQLLVPLHALQELKSEHGLVTSIDLMISDATPERIKQAAVGVRAIVDLQPGNYQVSSAQTKLEQLLEAEQISQVALSLVAFIALLTSFFIIVTTMSMGVLERIATFGTMRCLGVTRLQLGLLVFLEVLPIGVVGILAGLPIGWWLTQWGASYVPEYIDQVSLSVWGMWLAILGGAATVLLATGLLVVQVARVSPIEATKPESRPTRYGLVFVSALAGLGVLAIHQYLVESMEVVHWFKLIVAFSGALTLYLGYVLMAPALVVVAGIGAVHVASVVMGIKAKLARDQIGRSPWRSAAVCWMLMVGLSLIVYLGVGSESAIAAWDFPSKLPSSFVWSERAVPYSLWEQVKQVPGVGRTTVTTDVPCRIGDETTEPSTILEGIRNKLASAIPSTYVAGEMETFAAMTKMGFLQGEDEEVMAKLRKGGYVLLPPEASRSFDLGVGDKIKVTIGRRTAEFEIAGVVESPALNIAVSYFQADSYMMLAAAGAVLGTMEDAKRCFGLEQVSMFMMDVDLPPSRHPEEFELEEEPSANWRDVARFMLAWRNRLPNQQAAIDRVREDLEPYAEGKTHEINEETRLVLVRFTQAMRGAIGRWEELNPKERWDRFREKLVLHEVAEVMDRPNAIFGSLRTLKASIDRDIREVTRLMTAIPSIALIVAGLGIANLMMVNVNARSRQIGMMRAIGTTKWQIHRLVLAEALALGVLGSVVGVILGFHSAMSDNTITAKLIGIDQDLVIPWGRVAVGVGMTLAICVIAGIAPARHAARNNIVDAVSAM